MKQTVLGASADKGLRGVAFTHYLNAVIPSEAAAALGAGVPKPAPPLRVGVVGGGRVGVPSTRPVLRVLG